MLTNREILSKINEKGGGVSLENGGEILINGTAYNYGGMTMTDYEIMQKMNECGCDYDDNDDDDDFEYEFKKGGSVITYKNKYNKKYGYSKDESHSLKEISKDTGVSMKGLQQIYNKGIGAYKTNPSSVRPNVNSKEQWAMARVYSAVMGGKASKVDSNELVMEKGGLIAPNGKPSNLNAEQYKIVRTPEFKAWFGDWENDPANASKVVDENGEPKVMYHGSRGQFSIFSDENENKLSWTIGGKGFYFTSTFYNAYAYGENVFVCFIKAINPRMSDGKEHAYVSEYDLNKLKSYGSDSIYFDGERLNTQGKWVKVADELVVFEPNQIKLADGTNTTFNSNTDDIRYDDGGRTTSKNKELLNEGTDGVIGGALTVPFSDVVAGFNNLNGLEINNSTNVIYEKGGQSLSAEVFEWDKVPTNYRNISKVKKIPFSNNPIDKGLDSIITTFLGKDDLRPSMNGINFDENGITATNAHILITLPYPNEKYNGIYDLNQVKKEKSNEPILIFGNYPNYAGVIPKSKNAGKSYQIDVYKLLQYTKTALNYTNKITKAISYKFGEDEIIGFNGKFLSDVLTTALKLGHEKLYAFIETRTRAVVLSPNENYELGNDEILLIMPVMIQSSLDEEKKYGAEDIDYSRILRAYFDFNDSEIHNADGSVAEFKMQYENNLSVDDKYMALLSKITSKNNILQILNYAKVEYGKMTATDLDISLVIKDVNMPNGIYEIVNKAPNITMFPIEDFPISPFFKKNEVIINHNGSKATSFEFITFSEVFDFYLDKLLLSVGKDELRPIMSGICIKKTSANEIFLVTTNAHTLCKINITEYCEFNKDDRELEYILPIKFLKDFVKLADGSLHFKCNKTNIFIESDNIEFIGKAIDGNYPKYDAVIPIDNTKKIVFDHVSMKKCFKSQEMTNLLAKYKGQKGIYIDLFNISNNLNVRISKNVGFNKISENIEFVELCKIDFNYEIVETKISLNQSLFLLMPSKDEFRENQYFSFRKEYFEVMLNTITDVEVDCFFSEPMRPYIFPIDAIDYKKTLPEEKTKQQKLSKKDLQQISELEDLKDVLETISDEESKFEEIIDLGNNFDIRVEKVFYTNGDSTYGAVLYYNNQLFKYFVFVSNTSKKQATDNVYEYLKTLRVSDKILENAPKKGEFTVFYNDRGGEHKRIEDSKAQIEQFIFDVKSVTKAKIVPTIESKKSELNELQEAIETLEILVETAKGKDKKEIKEALEILKMLNN
jgi:DNA polymerase III sliding clamp (beta) subunit (PCNA family)